MGRYAETYKDLKKLGSVKVFKNEPLSRHTTFKIGGPADLLIIPSDLESLVKALEITKGIRKSIIGNGSNILVADSGIRGAVIKMSGGVKDIEFDGRKVKIGSGALMQTVLRRAAKMGLAGLEFASWVPAAVGGAVISNLGAFGEDIAGIIESAEVLTSSGKIETLSRSDMKFSYRNSKIKDCIIISASFELTHKKTDLINRKMKEFMEKRKETQPLSAPSAGSVFRNPDDVPAGKLIDMAGCKGWRFGGAEISKKHGNFIINLGDAKASDVRNLIRKVKITVKEKFKVDLELELVDSSQLNMLF